MSPVYNTWAFYWDETNILDDFSLGTLYQGENSDVVITTHTLIYVNFDVGGITYLTDPPFELNEHGANYIDINGNTTVKEVTGKKKGTLSQLDLEMIQENGQGILLKDLISQ